jgi:proline iminopeptidase
MNAPGNGGRRLTEHGIFVDVRGRSDGPALLFLHGGPGQGSYDFMALQGDRLAEGLRVVALDQRGVDRSASLPEGESLTVADLVDDCEAVRRVLGIDRWAVLGQSFGGMLALRYAIAHPGAVTAAVFENPSWDVALSARESLTAVAGLLAAQGSHASAQAARTAAEGDLSPKEVFASYMAALSALGDDREVYFVPDPQARERMQEIGAARARQVTADGQEDADGESTMRHHLAIIADETFYESALPLLSWLEIPALLITGEHDHVASAEQIDAFRAASSRNVTRRFEMAGHFVHAQDPELFAQAVIEFVRGH